MKTNKIIFAGVMGAILMSAGANAATSMATKGYVDQEVGKVDTTVKTLNTTVETLGNTIENLGDTYVTQESANSETNGYEKVSNKKTELSDSMKTDMTSYPAAGAVVNYITTAMKGVSPEQMEALSKLDVTTLQNDIKTLTGEGEGSVAKSIADALEPYSTTAQANGLYQAQSTADLQIGTTGGKFRDMTKAEKDALASGIDSDKVAAYDATKAAVDTLTNEESGIIAGIQDDISGLSTSVTDLTKTGGTIETIQGNVKELQDVVTAEGGLQDVVGATANDGLRKTVATNTSNITTLQDSPVYKPSECDKEACVLMVKGENVFWTPVTTPIDDPKTSTPTPAEGE